MQSDESSAPSEPTPSTPAPEPSLNDLMSGLSLTPTWAKPSGSTSAPERRDYSGYEPREERGRDRDRRGPPRGARPQGGSGGGGPRMGGGPRPGGPGGAGGGDRNRRPGPGRGPGAGRGPRRFEDRDARREERPVRLPVEISFIPERVQLAAVVRQMSQSLRAYPLFQLARLFLSKPEYHVVKFESRAPDLRFHVCTADQHIFLSEEALKNHVLSQLVEKFYEPVDVQAEAPSGNFVVVGRCRMSGELLGPPNHHNFNERLMELHRARFAHLPLAEYRSRIEMVRDPAVVDQWKEQSRTQRLYKPRDGGPDAAPVKRAEAEARVLAEHWQELKSVTGRALIPAKSAVLATDPMLAQALRDAWTRENRNPFRMALALRPAFRRMRMSFFKAGQGETFVTAVPPKPLDPAHAIEPLRNVLTQLTEHPGWSRPQLLEALQPGKAPDSPEASEVLGHVRWLVEKGHVIEFFNGTLTVPTPAHAPEPAPAAEKGEEAIAEAAPEAEPATPPEAPAASEPAPPAPPPPA